MNTTTNKVALDRTALDAALNLPRSAGGGQAFTKSAEAVSAQKKRVAAYLSVRHGRTLQEAQARIDSESQIFVAQAKKALTAFNKSLTAGTIAAGELAISLLTVQAVTVSFAYVSDEAATRLRACGFKLIKDKKSCTYEIQIAKNLDGSPQWSLIKGIPTFTKATKPAASSENKTTSKEDIKARLESNRALTKDQQKEVLRLLA